MNAPTTIAISISSPQPTIDQIPHAPKHCTNPCGIEDASEKLRVVVVPEHGFIDRLFHFTLVTLDKIPTCRAVNIGFGGNSLERSQRSAFMESSSRTRDAACLQNSGVAHARLSVSDDHVSALNGVVLFSSCCMRGSWVHSQSGTGLVTKAHFTLLRSCTVSQIRQRINTSPLVIRPSSIR